MGRGLGIMSIRQMVSFSFPPEGRKEGRKDVMVANEAGGRGL